MTQDEAATAIARCLEIDGLIASLSDERTKLTTQLELLFPAKQQTEVLHIKGLVAHRAVRHEFKFMPEGIPLLREVYGNYSHQLVSITQMTPTKKFRDMLRRNNSDKRINELRNHIRVTQRIDYSFHKK